MKTVASYLGAISRHSLGRTEEYQGKVNEDSWFHDRDSNRITPEYKPRTLPLY
jgi:hypothetical protein